MERFRAELALDLVERHRITGFIAATPMLQRMAQVPDIDERDLSSLSWVQQGAAPLPQWLGHRWIDLVGAEHFYMSYGSSEQIGLVVCRGDEWLDHPGHRGPGHERDRDPHRRARRRSPSARGDRRHLPRAHRPDPRPCTSATT